jgi:hypothetical protein
MSDPTEDGRPAMLATGQPHHDLALTGTLASTMGLNNNALKIDAAEPGKATCD